MNIEDLDGMSEKQVKQVAADLGVKFHHKHGKDTIIAKIKNSLDGVPDEDGEEDENEGDLSLETQVKQEVEPDLSPVDVPPVTTAIQSYRPDAPAPKLATWPTPKQVQEALKSHIARGLKIIQMTDEYWNFRVENREDSGNMKMPLSQFIMIANILLRPAKTARNDGSSA